MREPDTGIRMARTFDAPRDLVRRLWTDAERIPEFWGWRDSQTTVHAWDPRPGGAWRISGKGQDGVEYVFFGEFRDVEPNELLVWTFGYEGMTDEPLVQSLRFEEHDGRTTLLAKAWTDPPPAASGPPYLLPRPSIDARWSPA